MSKKTKRYIAEDENRSLVRAYCKYCGHSQTIPVYLDEKICSYCHMKIKNTTKAYFKKKMLEMMIRKENTNEEKLRSVSTISK